MRPRPTEGQAPADARAEEPSNRGCGIRGHALIQNLRRGHHELAVDVAQLSRWATAFEELRPAVWSAKEPRSLLSTACDRTTQHSRLTAPTAAGLASPRQDLAESGVDRRLGMETSGREHRHWAVARTDQQLDLGAAQDDALSAAGDEPVDHLAVRRT